jgi:hypothetical protein
VVGIEFFLSSGKAKVDAFRFARSPIKSFGIAKDIEEFSGDSRHNYFAMASRGFGVVGIEAKC